MWIALALLVILFLLSLIYTLSKHQFPLNFLRNLAQYDSTRTDDDHKKTNRPELAAVFATFDRNKDGLITKQELAESLRGSGMEMSDEDISDEFKKVDSNGDGLIDLEEFCGIFESKEINKGEGEKGDEELRGAFDVFDGNGDGLITVEELGLMMSSLGFIKEGNSLNKCREMIKSVDKDGDGMVNFEEFKKMMMISKSRTGIVSPS
ncbi:calmodulin-like protein 3 [Impatiens glandulifera]|uniref:calmodulin-like protein 3 n=1 Tax=Impatiens glandulifera TaxID=253017 RepID=UPI001FB174DC|nr:calmodulin-like protein 3 [Impatiens glandulifera]